MTNMNIEELEKASQNEVPSICPNIIAPGIIGVVGPNLEICEALCFHLASRAAEEGATFLGQPLEQCRTLVSSLDLTSAGLYRRLHQLGHTSANIDETRIEFQIARDMPLEDVFHVWMNRDCRLLIIHGLSHLRKEEQQQVALQLTGMRNEVQSSGRTIIVIEQSTRGLLAEAERFKKRGTSLDDVWVVRSTSNGELHLKVQMSGNEWRLAWPSLDVVHAGTPIGNTRQTILSVLADHPSGLRSVEIAQLSGLALSVVHQQVYKMKNDGQITKDGPLCIAGQMKADARRGV